ncbi:MAG: thioesterase family protein [Proteobacteria bacterium]|nr:thioesterase family protein [Pseudomonadota bacterium]
MARNDFKFHHTMRVRYAEVDAQAVVFNAHYLTYFDVGHTEYMRAAGVDYAGHVAATGIDFHLVKSVVEYRQPILFDQEMDVCVRVGRIGNTSVQNLFEIHAHGDENLLASGETILVAANLATHRPVPVPDWFADGVRAFEGPAFDKP